MNCKVGWSSKHGWCTNNKKEETVPEYRLRVKLFCKEPALPSRNFRHHSQNLINDLIWAARPSAIICSSQGNNLQHQSYCNLFTWLCIQKMALKKYMPLPHTLVSNITTPKTWRLLTEWEKTESVPMIHNPMMRELFAMVTQGYVMTGKIQNPSWPSASAL